MQTKKQQCPMPAIYLNWLLLAVGAAFFLIRYGWAAALAWTAAVPLSLWGYVRIFPRVSAALGYGRIVDEPAGPALSSAADRVTLYTAMGCPFCSIMRDRLRVLSGEWGFELEEIDVTAHPNLQRAREIRAVPVVEVEGRVHVGAATTRQLAALIRRAPVPAEPMPVPAGAA